jgi:hypothetical protein
VSAEPPPPPPPQVSPDGKFWWDGAKWVPMEKTPMRQMPQPAQPRRTVGCVTHTTCLTLVGLFVLVAAVLLIAGVCSSIASQH